jgi:hypothetical protein
VYQLVVGEIGISREAFLYKMDFWEVKRVVAGYRDRQRAAWEVARWQTFWLMQVGMADTSKIDFDSLLRFPWEDPAAANEPTEEEIERLRNELREYNKNNGK